MMSVLSRFNLQTICLVEKSANLFKELYTHGYQSRGQNILADSQAKRSLKSGQRGKRLVEYGM